MSWLSGILSKFCFWRSKSSSNDEKTPLNVIPIIDISPWLWNSSEEARMAVVEEVRHACVTYGFFQLVGHSIPLSLQEEVFDCAEALFALPADEKMEVSIKKSLGLSNRGYEAFQGQTLQTGMLPDMKEVSRYTLYAY